MDLKEKIQYLIDNKGVSPYQMSIDSNISQSTISRILSGETKKLNLKNKKLIANYFSINEDDLNDLNDFEISNFNSNKQITGYYHPNVSAAAGMDKVIHNDELNRIPISLPNWEKGIDFINVYGDSMYPKFCSGEIIGIKEVELQYVNYGYAYVVIFNDGQVFLKFIRKGKDDQHCILASENPKYESKEYHLSLIKKVYIIKGVITKTTM